MGKRYTPKKFSPIIFQEWGELFKELTPEQKSEVLMGITMFPEYEVTCVPIWSFIRSQLQNQLDSFTDKCQKNGETIRTYWETRGNERLTNDNERLTNENEGKPKPELLPEPEYKYKPELLTNNQDENQVDCKNIIKKVGSKFSINTKQIIIDEHFSAKQYDDLKVYVEQMPEDVIRSVEQWLIKSKLGQTVDCAFIAKQFINFAKRQGRPFFKDV